MVEKLRKKLYEYVDEEYAKFNRKLCPDTKKEILGVRMLNLRRIAKDFVKEDNYRRYLDEVLDINKYDQDELKKGKDKYFEEIIMQGLIIGYGKMDLESKLFYLKSFIPKIDSWAITDTVIPTLKIKEKDLETLWNFILPYTNSEKEFEVRFAVIMMLDYFINDFYVDRVIEKIDEIKNDKYYAKMAMAWTLAEIGIKYQDKAFTYLKGENNLDKFTFNKTLQKMIESYRIDDDIKDTLRKMKRK